MTVTSAASPFPLFAMASHYKLYDGLNEVVPFNARYSYPTQANMAWKQNIKIPTSNGQTFYPGGNNPSITLPAQGYLNTRNSFLEFEIGIEMAGNSDDCTNVRFQNNIQSIFNRLQLRYGSLSLEDIREAGPLIRILTDSAGTNTCGVLDQNAIAEGVGGCFPVLPETAAAADATDLANTRNYAIQSANYDSVNGLGRAAVCSTGIVQPKATATDTTPGTGTDTGADTGPGSALAGAPAVGRTNGDVPGPQAVRYRQYQCQPLLGLFQQNKLLPLKWMASQLTLEFTLASMAACMTGEKALPLGSRYVIRRMVLNAELLEFDGSYDAAFLEGLRGDGVPIKFASWDTFMFTPMNSNQQTLPIAERNRSLKAVFVVQTPPPMFNHNLKAWDSHALLHSSAGLAPSGGASTVGIGHITGYQWRIGGKYYPAQPVACGDGTTANGGAEAYHELEKALNIVGDYRLSTGQNPLRWLHAGGLYSNNRRVDYKGISRPYDWPAGSNVVGRGGTDGDFEGPSSFVIALDMETSRGGEVSGLNGEEQNDISLSITYNSGADQFSGCQYYAYVYYDALLVLRENNLVELIK